VQAVHPVRQQVVKERAALANQLRVFLAEHGVVIRKGFAAVRRALPQIIGTATMERPQKGLDCLQV